VGQRSGLLMPEPFKSFVFGLHQPSRGGAEYQESSWGSRVNRKPRTMLAVGAYGGSIGQGQGNIQEHFQTGKPHRGQAMPGVYPAPPGVQWHPSLCDRLKVARTKPHLVDTQFQWAHHTLTNNSPQPYSQKMHGVARSTSVALSEI
jgi:hypothetical protein